MTAVTPPGLPAGARPSKSRARWLVWFFGAWALLVTGFLALATLTTPDRILRAVTGMALGLALLWIVGFGSLTLLLRRPIRRALRRLAGRWRLAFVAFATALALVEEAITTAMTNAAPWWGVPIGKAYITASANYLEVVAYHSVVVFVPMFIVWAWLLTRYRFHPSAVFVLFGGAGVLAETVSFGAQNVLMMGFWVYVYGLMIYLPAYTLPPEERLAQRPGWWVYLVALLLPILAAVPVALALQIWRSPQHAFPPLQSAGDAARVAGWLTGMLH